MRIQKLLYFLIYFPFILQAQVNLLPSIGIGFLPNDNDSVCPIIPRAQGNPWNPIYVGDTMADFTLFDINGNAITLSDVLNTGKKVLMISGSYTCPIFRDHMTDANAVAAQFANDIEVFVVYNVEAHPTGSVMPSSGNVQPTNPPYYQPSTYLERKNNLLDMINGVGSGPYCPVPINVPIYIDGPCNEWWEYYGASPNCAYLIDTNGVLFAFHEWFHNTNPPSGPPTNIYCDIDSLLGITSGGCSQVISLTGMFDFQLKSTSTNITFGNPGDVIDIFGEIINISNDGVKVNISRILNDLPSNTWESSMCVSVCLPSSQDTTSAIVAAGDTLDFSFHFFTDPLMVGPDTARARCRFTNNNGSQQSIVQPYMGITFGSTANIVESYSDFVVYPNPSNGDVNLAFEFTQNSIVQVLDILGQVIRTIQVNKGENKVHITNLPASVYLIRVNEQVCKKIIVN